MLSHYCCLSFSGICSSSVPDCLSSWFRRRKQSKLLVFPVTSSSFKIMEILLLQQWSCFSLAWFSRFDSFFSKNQWKHIDYLINSKHVEVKLFCSQKNTLGFFVCQFFGQTTFLINSMFEPMFPNVIN